MTDHWESWLPKNVVPPPGVAAALDILVQQWSQHWFGQYSFAVRRPIQRGGVTTRPISVAHHANFEGGLTVSMVGASTVILGALAAGLTPNAEWSVRDEEILRQVGEKALADFHSRLAKWSLPGAQIRDGEKAGWSPGAEWRAEVGAPAAAPIIVLQWSDACMADIVKRALPPLKSAPLGKPAYALAKVPVSLGAFAGRSRLKLADLRNLSLGDTVILDRELGKPLDCVIEGTIDPGRPCRLSGDAGHAELIFA